MFKFFFTRKAHDIIALFLAPIDLLHFDYYKFIIKYEKEANGFKEKKKECVFMDKMNYTAFNIVYDNWFEAKDW